MAALLACPEGAVLSHSSAAALWGISREKPRIEVSLPRRSRSNREGIVAHRPTSLAPSDLTRRHGIPVTRAARTLIDIAPRLSDWQLEAAVNRADNHDLVDPECLADQVRHLPGSTGAAALRALLEPSTFRLTDSELERMLLRLVRSAKLPLPDTQVRLRAGRVDFLWRELGLVVEADGLRYHRTAATQARDAKRDRAHAADGLITLRFTHHEVRHEPRKVASELAGVMARLEVAGGSAEASDAHAA